MKFVFIYFLYYVFLVGWVIVTLGIAYKMNAIPTAVLTRVRAKVVGLVDARHVTRE